MIHPSRLAPDVSGHTIVKCKLDCWVLDSPVPARKFRVMAILEWPVSRIFRILVSIPR